jgi:hypothetical protein
MQKLGNGIYSLLEDFLIFIYSIKFAIIIHIHIMNIKSLKVIPVVIINA